MHSISLKLHAHLQYTQTNEVQSPQDETNFENPKDVSYAFPIHFYNFLATKTVLVEVWVGKTGFFKNVSKNYIMAIFSVLMNKVIFDKFKQFFLSW